MVRLVDEHLIIDRGGVLAGLHQLRSRALMEAVHRTPPPDFSDTVRRVGELVDPLGLQSLLTGLLMDGALDDEAVVDLAVRRVRGAPDLASLASALHALRLAGFQRMTGCWKEAIAEADVAPEHVIVICHLVLHDGDESIFPERIQKVVRHLRSLPVPDLRKEFITYVDIASVLETAADSRDQSAALAALAGIEGPPLSIDPQVVARVAQGAPLDELRLLLESVYLADNDLARNVVEALGGSNRLLERLEHEQPWVRRACLSTLEDGRLAASADYAFVAERQQSQPHDEVVDLCRFLLALAPESEVAVCRAVDATGNLAGIGVPIANKTIPRENLPSKPAIAWNRARTRAALRAVAAPSKTEYLLGALAIVRMAAEVSKRAANVWAREKPPSVALSNELDALQEAVQRLQPPPMGRESSGALDEGHLPGNDPASQMGTLGVSFLVELLTESPHPSRLEAIVGDIDQLSALNWALIGEEPVSELASMRQTFGDLYAVLVELSEADPPVRAALQAARRRGFGGMARVARQSASERAQKQREEIAGIVGGLGLEAQVACPEPDLGAAWSGTRWFIAVDVAEFSVWFQQQEALVGALRSVLDQVGFSMAPRRGGLVVGSLAIQVYSNVHPDPSAEGWAETGFQLLNERLVGLVRDVLASLYEMSGIVASLTAGEIHPDEKQAFDAANESVLEGIAGIEGCGGSPGDDLLTEIRGSLDELQEQVRNEVEAWKSGAPVEQAIAAIAMEGLRGKSSDLRDTEAGLVLAAAEFDIDPRDAWDRVFGDDASGGG